MENILDELGFVHILEKKEVIIDGEKQEYYQHIDVAFGFKYPFSSGCRFVVLSGKKLGRTISVDESKTNYRIVGFQSFRELCKKSDNSLEITQFQSDYQACAEEYYILQPNKTGVITVKDPTLLQKIRGKDYNDSVFDKSTDISKMYAAIKKTIVAQDEQIMQILTSLYKNQKVVNSSLSEDMIAKLKENIIIYGSTGTGKTEILKRIASIYEVPIVIEDATSLSEIGYVGRNITDMLEDLYLAAGKDIKKAQNGILVIDEFDKLAENEKAGKDHVSRIGVQRSLLKLLDGSVFYFKDKKFDTSKLTIVALGAFTNLVTEDDYSKVTSVDFVNYGIMRELMGRFSSLIAMNPLSKEDIKKILVESNFSPLNTYKLLFDSMNIECTYDDDFVDYIAEKAVSLNTGARSLKTIFDDVISSAMFRIFAGDYSAIHLTKPSIDKKAYVLTAK